MDTEALTDDEDIVLCSAMLHAGSYYDQPTYCDEEATREIDGEPWCDNHMPIEYYEEEYEPPLYWPDENDWSL